VFKKEERRGEGEEREGERKKARSSSCQTTQRPSFHDQALNRDPNQRKNKREGLLSGTERR